MTATDAACVAVDANLAYVVDDDIGMRHFIWTTLAQLGV
jgi:hypothetical protein